MTYLLDTHALLFWLFDDDRLSKRASAILADRENRLLVSSASAWEIATKFRLGRLPGVAALMTDMAGWIANAGFEPLPIAISHAHKAGAFPQPHRDPFDRMIAAQALVEGHPVVGRDEALADFGATLVW